MLNIRKALPGDAPTVVAMAREIVNDGTTYTFAPDSSDAALHAYWMSPNGHTFVATLNDDIVGCYIIKPNHSGRGSHVANASYMVASKAAGQGIGFKLGEHSIKQARVLGFKAMQFNIVIATNTRAVDLWKRLGFSIVGTLPKVFDHPTLGYVDAYVMHRFL
jgi:L-amino acid N-acyltransferase YncA